MIVLDTSVLSVVLRRGAPGQHQPITDEYARLVEQDAPLCVPGAVLQEVLSGIRSEAQFQKLRGGLKGFPILLAGEADHVLAAQINNACRRHGIAASSVDCLIAALTIGQNGEFWTLDQDFQRMARCCDLKLFRP